MKTLGTYSYENLFISSTLTIVTEEITVAESQNLSRGAVFELNASGQAVVPTGAPIDPTKVYGIIAETTVTGAAETKKSIAYLTGEFNRDAIIVPAGVTVADYKVPLRKLGIFLKSAVKA